ncbi:MAG: hypothetical protein E7641_08580 [Ruminococcaceae bacterium]|nr:hypothetical protein [Oscillospiraceae bacterium]
MQIDRQSLEKLLTLNDRQLIAVINRLAADSGIDLSAFGVSSGDVKKLRSALGSATDEDLERVAKLYEENKSRGKS